MVTTEGQEQFFLWEKYAKKYELDYILVGPRWFHPDRSAVFRKNWSFELKEPLHYPKERFILENKQLKLVHINGKTLKERYKNYYKLIPSWTAFRYDIRPFFILEKFFNLNQIRNTFYYLSNQKPLLEISDFPINKEYFSIYELYTQSINSIVEKEIAQINILLLERIMKLHPKKLLILIDNLVVSEYRNTSYYSHLKDIYNITWINYPFKRHSLYRSYGHYSSLGYELSADLFFNALIGKKHFIWKRIKCDFKKKAYKVKNRDIDLTQVSAISLSSPLTPLFHFKGKVRKKNYQFSNKNTKSFLSFSSKKSNKFGNTAYYPLPIKLKNNMEIYMKFSGGSKTSLGTIQAFDPYEKFFEFSTNYLSYYSSDVNQETYFIIENLPALLKEKIKKSFGPIKLFVENYYLGELHFYHPEIYQNKKLIFKSQSENNLLLHGHDQLIREAELADKFPLYIKYAMNNGKIFKGLIPNWSCSKEPRKIPLNTINFEPLEKM